MFCYNSWANGPVCSRNDHSSTKPALQEVNKRPCCAQQRVNVKATWQVYPGNGSVERAICAITLRLKSLIKFAISSSHSTLTPSQPVPVLILQQQVPGKVTTGVPIFKSLVWLVSEISPWRKRTSNSGLSLSRWMHWPLGQRGGPISTETHHLHYTVDRGPMLYLQFVLGCLDIVCALKYVNAGTEHDRFLWSI